MNKEIIVTELQDAVIVITELINNVINLINNTLAPADDATPPAPENTGPVAGLIMTAAANGASYQQFKNNGWSDEQMITGGVATAPVPAAPAAPATPATPAAPATPATPTAQMTVEQLNAALVAEFNRLGDRTPIDAALKELGVAGVKDLPVDKYQTLIDNVKKVVKAV